MKKHLISSVEAGSIAEELDIKPGEYLISVNDEPINDVFDYHFLINDDELSIQIEKLDGTIEDIEIEKDYYEDLGIVFENGLMDEYKSCCNKCIFCFIDQMPPNMRDTLYFKDDDSRLSFLQGNYVTLTNMKDEDVDRIIKYHLDPINISVQATEPELRCMMLHNRFAGEALKKMDKFNEAGIIMNGQIVLCKGVNDGEHLEKSIQDLMKYIPNMKSVSVVPAGLTKFRDNLYPLELFTKEEAIEVLDMIHKYQDICMEQHGIHFIHASDEWYLLAERDIPEADTYDGYLQLENGVGMIRLLEEEFMEALKEESKKGKKLFSGLRKKEERTISIATGKLAAPLLRKLTEAYTEKHPETHINVYEIRNDFFGESITVSGLITGKDLLEQLKDKRLGERLLLPCNMLRSGESVFLDDITISDLENALQIKVSIVESDGQCLLEALN